MEKREYEKRVPSVYELDDLLTMKCAPDYPFRQLAEECAELAQAALKLIRAMENSATYKVDRDAAMKKFIEEMANVSVMWNIAMLHMRDDTYDKMFGITDEKSKRMGKRLEALPDRVKTGRWTVELPRAEASSKGDTMDEAQASVHDSAAGTHIDTAKIPAFINDYFNGMNKQ